MNKISLIKWFVLPNSLLAGPVCYHTLLGGSYIVKKRNLNAYDRTQLAGITENTLSFEVVYRHLRFDRYWILYRYR